MERPNDATHTELPANGAHISPSAALDLQIDHVCINVSDIDEAIAWYRANLGFEVEIEWQVPELEGFRFAYLQRAGFRIELIDAGGPRENATALDFEAFLRRPGYNHLCFRVPDVDRAAGAIRRSGTSFDLEPTDYPDVGRRVAFFRDPFGNYLELAGPLSPTAAVARSQ